MAKDYLLIIYIKEEFIINVIYNTHYIFTFNVIPHRIMSEKDFYKSLRIFPRAPRLRVALRHIYYSYFLFTQKRNLSLFCLHKSSYKKSYQNLVKWLQASCLSLKSPLRNKLTIAVPWQYYLPSKREIAVIFLTFVFAYPEF